MNEAETRAEHVDPALAGAGWGVVEGSCVRREYPITLGRIEGNGRRGKALSANYVLEYRNTRLAVVEAKAWDKPLSEGVGQAKEYAGKLTPLLRLKYHDSIADAVADLGKPDEIGKVFSGFQKYLYQPQAAAT
jgi:type I site-specific restriction endonuclease